MKRNKEVGSWIPWATAVKGAQLTISALIIRRV